MALVSIATAGFAHRRAHCLNGHLFVANRAQHFSVFSIRQHGQTRQVPDAGTNRSPGPGRQFHINVLPTRREVLCCRFSTPRPRLLTGYPPLRQVFALVGINMCVMDLNWPSSPTGASPLEWQSPDWRTVALTTFRQHPLSLPDHQPAWPVQGACPQNNVLRITNLCFVMVFYNAVGPASAI